MIKISTRLEKIADYILGNESIIDIGCDHGLLDIYLAQKYKDIKIIASDTNENALSGAIKNIKKHKLSKRITTILSNGLFDIDTSCSDTIIIAGMGAHTMTGILYQNLKKLKSIKRLILQSNNDLYFLRYKITKLGYYIKREELVNDGGIIYTIIEFEKGYRYYTKLNLYFGPLLLKERSNLFLEFINKELVKLESFYPNIPKKNVSYRFRTYLKIKSIRHVLRK